MCLQFKIFICTLGTSYLTDAVYWRENLVKEIQYTDVIDAITEIKRKCVKRRKYHL